MSEKCEPKSCNCCLCKNNEFSLKKAVLLPVYIFAIFALMLPAIEFSKLLVDLIVPENAPEKHLKIESFSHSCNQEGSRDWISTIGKVNNLGKRKYGNVYFNASFFNSNGDLIDSATINQKDLYVPRGDSAGFSITHPARVSCDNYDSLLIKVVHSDANKDSETKKENRKS